MCMTFSLRFSAVAVPFCGTMAMLFRVLIGRGVDFLGLFFSRLATEVRLLTAKMSTYVKLPVKQSVHSN